MGEFQIDRDNGASLAFKGEIIAQVSNEQHTLTIYLTEAKRFVCHRLDHSNKKSLAVVCDDHKAIIDFFGNDDLAKDLYIKGGISTESADGMDILEALYKLESLLYGINLISERLSHGDSLNHSDVILTAESIASIAERGADFCLRTANEVDRARLRESQ